MVKKIAVAPQYPVRYSTLKIVQATSSCKDEMPEAAFSYRDSAKFPSARPRAFPASTNIPRPALAEGLFVGTSSYGPSVFAAHVAVSGKNVFCVAESEGPSVLQQDGL